MWLPKSDSTPRQCQIYFIFSTYLLIFFQSISSLAIVFTRQSLSPPAQEGECGGAAAASDLRICHQKHNDHWKTFQVSVDLHPSQSLSHLHLCRMSALPLAFFFFYRLRLRPSESVLRGVSSDLPVSVVSWALRKQPVWLKAVEARGYGLSRLTLMCQRGSQIFRR